MLTVCAYLFASQYRFAQRAIRVKATVIAYDNQSEGSSMYSPLFEFSFNGVKRTYQSHVSSSSPEFEIGESVEILVDPNDPQSVLINTFLGRWLAFAILGFLGTLFTTLGYLVLRVFAGSQKVK